MGEIYENGLKFECRRCSYCCGNGPGFVYLSAADLQKLSDAHGMEPKDFVEKYCRWVMYYGGDEVLALQEKKNYDCILWNEGCTSYLSRPVQCSTYPFWTWMMESEESWNECAKTCPGMNSGKFHTKEEILAQKELFDKNMPLKKTDFI